MKTNFTAFLCHRNLVITNFKAIGLLQKNLLWDAKMTTVRENDIINLWKNILQLTAQPNSNRIACTYINRLARKSINILNKSN
jgi:hypothetical protein